MQLVKDGPNIAAELLQKLEDGELIFFCGAGVSYPAGLPSFKGLVESVYQNLHEAMQPEEQQSFDSGSYDRTLGLLESRLNDPSLVREEIINILEIDPASRKLSTYKAILALSLFDDSKYRAVTTNFDRGFVIAGGESLTVDSAPEVTGAQGSPLGQPSAPSWFDPAGRCKRKEFGRYEWRFWGRLPNRTLGQPIR